MELALEGVDVVEGEEGESFGGEKDEVLCQRAVDQVVGEFGGGFGGKGFSWEPTRSESC